MKFSQELVQLLQYFGIRPPAHESAWHGPWMGILMTLFPMTDSYIVTPQKHLGEEGGNGDDVWIEVAHFDADAPTLQMRTVLVVKIKSIWHWNDVDKAALMKEITRKTEAAFSEHAAARGRVYWISAIGPQWRFGEKLPNGQDPRPLIPWHGVTHDQASYNDLQTLANLVRAL